MDVFSDLATKKGGKKRSRKSLSRKSRRSRGKSRSRRGGSTKMGGNPLKSANS